MSVMLVLFMLGPSLSFSTKLEEIFFLEDLTNLHRVEIKDFNSLLKEITKKKENFIVVKNEIIIQKNTIIPENITIIFGKNGSFYTEKNKNLCINGSINAPLINIFKGEGSIELGNKIMTVFPEWWGLFGNADKSIRSEILTKKMLQDIKSTGNKHLHFSSGTYLIRDLIIDFSNLIVSGNGKATIIKNNSKKYSSTHLGAFIAIMGPTSGFTGNDKWLHTTQIKNIQIKNLAIEYNGPDPHMNGVAISNAKNVIIDNVSVNLNGGKRAFYVGSWHQGAKTQDIIIENSRSINSRTGVFITVGGVNQKTNSDRILSNILVQGCSFIIPNLNKIGNRNLDQTNGIYVHGNSIAPNCITKNITIKKNKIIGGDDGIITSGPDKDGAIIQASLKIISNHFKNFTNHGIQSLLKEVSIEGNFFDSIDIVKAVISSAGIQFYGKGSYGVSHSVIKNNVFIRIKSRDHSQTKAIQIVPIKGSLHIIEGNIFKYDGEHRPDYDLFVYSKRKIDGLIILRKNHFTKNKRIYNNDKNFIIKDIENIQ